MDERLVVAGIKIEGFFVTIRRRVGSSGPFVDQPDQAVQVGSRGLLS